MAVTEKFADEKLEGELLSDDDLDNVAGGARAVLNNVGNQRNDEKVFPAQMTAEQLERKIDSLAPEANHFSKVNDLIGGLWKFFTNS